MRPRVITPPGVNVAVGVVTSTRSPTLTPICLARSRPSEDSRTFVFGAFEREQLALLHGPLDVRDVTFEGGVDTFERNERRLASARDNGLAEYGWAGSGHARELAQPLDFGVIVVNPARSSTRRYARLNRGSGCEAPLEVRSSGPAPQPAPKPHGHANGREQRDAGDRRVLSAREEVTEGDEQLKRHDGHPLIPAPQRVRLCSESRVLRDKSQPIRRTCQTQSQEIWPICIKSIWHAPR